MYKLSALYQVINLNVCSW